jgi:oxygen-independent coproporphyrinogen-3 oxidase
LKFELIGEVVETLGNAGYVAIGMDHFARPGDDLAHAARERRLHRNFMGYTTQPASDLLGLGVSAIGDVQGAFAQNVKKLTSYYAALDSGRFPIERGRALEADDLVRRHVITQLMCAFRVDRTSVAGLFGLDFDSYFRAELETLRAVDGAVDHGLLADTPGALEVTPRGRLFVRSICMTFDRYLPAHQGTPVFSRTI